MSNKAQTSAPYSPGQDPASIEANRAYQDALKKLTESLDQRKNRFFEPTLLAAAQGFMQPGTSNFFDSLGNVAGNIAKSQEAQIAEDQAIAQQRVELAGRGVELQRQKGKDAMWRSASGDQPAPQGGLSAAAQPPSTQSPAAGSGALPSGGQGATGPLAQAAKGNAPSGSPFMPGQQGPSRQQFFAAAQMDGKTLSDAMKEWEAIEKGQIQIKDKFGTNLRTGEIFHVPSGTMVPTQVFREDETVGTYLLPEHVAAQLSIYLGKGDADSYFELANKYIKAPQRKQVAPAAAVSGVPAALGAAPTAERPATPASSGAAKPTGLKTVQESERESARAKALQDFQVGEEVNLRKAFNQRATDADDTLATSNVMRAFTNRNDFQKMTGILSNDKISSGIATLIKEGIGGKEFSIGMPAIEDVMRNARLTPEQQATYRTFLMYATQMQLNAERAMKGATTQNERAILGNANISPLDTSESVRRKADLLAAKAEFDKKVARAFKSSNMDAEDFKNSEDYSKMFSDYYGRISDIAVGLKQFQTVTPTPKPNTVRPTASQPAGAATPAAVQPSPGFVQDKKTGVIRRKKEGE